MIPKAAIDVEIISVENAETNRTYKIVDNKIQGFVDGLEALKQAIYKMLNTERFEYPIYSFNYGIELESLIGKAPTYVQIELKRRIRECLLRDEHITEVDNFRFNVTGDEMLCVFDVHSVYGVLELQKEVAA